jgi:hypothetical protein
VRRWASTHPRLVVAALLGAVAMASVVVALLVVRTGGDHDDQAGRPTADLTTATTTTTTTTTPEADTTTTSAGRPHGELGRTDGGGREVAPGVVAERFTSGEPDGEGHRTGRISLAGPGGTTLHGTYRYVGDEDWVVSVDGAEGDVGGVAVGAASGEISFVGSLVAADVHVDLPGHPRPVPAWDQTARLAVTHGEDGRGLVGAVAISASRGRGAIAMSGPVADDGSYELRVAGHLELAGSTVLLEGSYVGHGETGLPDHRWSIQGAGSPGAIDDTPVVDIAVAMTEARPGVTGSAGLVLGGAPSLVVATELHFIDESTWELEALGASTSTWVPDGMSGLAAGTDEIAGKVASAGGEVIWTLRSPMQLRDDELTMAGTLAIFGSHRYTAYVTGASGSVLGATSSVDFGTVGGTVRYDRGEVSGSVLLTTSGNLLIELPGGWGSRASLRLRFATGPGQPSTTTEVTYSMTDGASALHLEGSFDSSSSFALDASGSVGLAGASIPFGGWYRSAGYVVDGTPLAAPAWELLGSIADVDGGAVGIGSGAALVGGFLAVGDGTAPASGRADPETRSRASALVAAPAESSTSFSGEVEVQLSEGDSFTLAAELDYVDDDDWVLTVASVQAEPWSPPGMTGLTVGIDAFSGTVTSEAGEVTWDVAIDEVVWEGATNGVTITTGFTLGTSCPLDEHCPDAEGIFAGFHDGEITFPDGVPDMELDGGFLTDGSWARFEARPDDVAFGGVEIADAAFTMWKGPRRDTFDPGLEMPDLSGANNDFGLEFCGSLHIEVPDVATVESGGCASWTPDGVVLAQIGTGGDIDSGESNGVRIGNVTLQGFGWTDLGTRPVVTIAGIDLPLERELNQLTASMHIPANLMKATGNPEADATIGATGWFDDADLSLDGDIDVSMRSGGFTLDSVSVHIGKDGDQFSLGLGADATVSMSGNHFPVSAFVGVEAGGGSSEIVVRLSAQGAVSEDPNGGFELPTLLPAGDFEPDHDSLLDGDFDTKPESSLLGNGDFEDAVESENLFTNAGFEDGAGENLFPEGDFEGGEAGNLLPNGDLEDADVTRNGDFETGDTMGWSWSSGYSVSVLSDITAPTEDEGATALELRNTQSSGSTSTTATGLSQDVHWAPTEGASYELSAWVRTADLSTRTVALLVDQKGTAPGCSTQATATTAQDFTVDGNWSLLSMPVAGTGCRERFTLTVNPVQGGARVIVDAVRFELVSSPVVVDIPGTERPLMRSTTGTSFDSLPPITRSSSSDIALYTDHGNPGTSLRSNGNNKWWLFNEGTYGDVTGDFDLSYDVYFPEASNRDMLDMGFWISGSDGNNSATGYLFRVQSSNNESGFYRINKGNRDRVSGDANFSPLKREVWHRVRLTAVGSNVTATITRIDTAEQIYRRTMTMPSGNRSGVFGQLKTNNGASAGHRVDNLHVHSAPGSGQAVRFDPGGARTGDQYLAMGGPSGWSMLAASGEAPEVGQVYTFTAWLQASAAMSGQLSIETEGGTREVATVPVSVGSTSSWLRYSVTLPITKAGHTGVRVGFTSMTPGDVELRVDDMVLQEIGWGASPTTPAGLNALVVDQGGSSVRSGQGSLFLFDRSSGTSSLHRDLVAPEAGATYTAKVWLTSLVPGDVALRLTALGGTEETSVATVAPTGTWTEHSVTLPVTRSGHTALRLAVEVKSSLGSVYVDDIVVSGVGHAVPQAPEAAWAGSGTTRVLPDPANARSGLAHLQLTGSSGAGGSTARTVEAAPTPGNTYVGRAWVRAPGAAVSGALTLSTGLEAASVDFTADGTWQEVAVPLPVTAAGATGLTLVFDNKVAGAALDVDDVSVRLEGLTQPSPWIGVAGTGGTVPVAVWSDPAQAHGGSGYLKVEAVGSPGHIESTVSTAEASPPAGSQHTATAWVRSASGAAVHGALELAADGGDGAVARAAFTATGEWQPVYVTLPIGQDGVTALSTRIEVSTLGAPLLVDDVALRSVPTWVPLAPPGVEVDEVVLVGDGSAASGPGHLRVRSTGPGGGVTTVSPATVRPGGSYTMQAYVRSASGAPLGGQLDLSATGEGDETASLPFTADGGWQHVEVSLEATQAATALQPVVALSQAGELDVDQITITQDVIVQEDPWSTDAVPGGSVSATVYEDPERAHDSYGLLVLRTEGPAGSGVSHAVAHAPAAGSTVAGSAWVRSASGTPVTGQLRVAALGGSPTEAVAGFTAGDAWQQVSVRLPISGSGHTSMHVSLVVDTPGVELDVDDVKVQTEVWTTHAPSGGQVTQTQVNDGERAESGNGYLSISKSTGSEGGVQLETPGAVAAGSSQTVSAYVRSSDGEDVAGRLRLVATGGGVDDVATAGFTAGQDWKKVTLTLPVAHGGQTGLRTQVLVDEVGAGLDVDSVTIGQEPLGEPDGVTAPLPHPERGYAYLWEDAFGIEGAHLWALTAQITFTNGSPGLGVGGTVYFDPTAMPGVMAGTEWLKGDMVLNVSRAEPCLSFGFDGTGTDTRVEIDGGVFSTSRFMLGFAPRGCEVGDYVVPVGSSLAFDTELGDASLHLDLQIGRDDDGIPTFFTDMAVHDLVLAGTSYDTMSLLVDISAAGSYVGFVGDFTLPMGKFYGDFELSADADLLHMEGQVSIRDWKLAGGGFDVDELSYHQVLDVPFGAGACASFAAGTDGRMSMGGKRYAFDGDIELDCGVLKVLHISFDYLKGGQSYRFDLDYDAGSRRLEGGVGFKFERKTSWKFWGYRYQRHPKFQVDVDFSMNVDKPESAALRIRGKVSVSGGSGSLDCSINTGADDGCSIYVRINKFGGHTYRSSW